MEQKINIHAGHRQRLKERIKKMDMTELDDLYFLEQLLTYSIPRADTNPLAHRLLDEFKTIDNMLEADESSLLEVEGVGPRTASFLKYMLLVCYKYNKARATKRTYVGTFGAITQYLKGIIPPDAKEQMVILCLNKSLEVKNYKITKGVNHSLINVNIEELVSYLLKNNSTSCVLAHTHPEGRAIPSKSDLDAFIGLRDMLGKMSIELTDSIILGRDDFYSSKLQDCRSYDLIDNISDKRIDALPDAINA